MHKKTSNSNNLDNGTGLADFLKQRRQKTPALNHLADASPWENFPMENQKPEAVHNSVYGLFFSLDDLFPGAYLLQPGTETRPPGSKPQEHKQWHFDPSTTES